MELVSPNKVRYGNYIFPLGNTIISLHKNALTQLSMLFSKHRVSPVAVFSVPGYWTIVINIYIKKMIEVDPKMEIAYIKEKNGRLSMSIFTDVDKERRTAIYDHLWAAKNAVDRAIHHRVNMCKVEDIDKKWLAIPTNLSAASVRE